MSKQPSVADQHREEPAASSSLVPGKPLKRKDQAKYWEEHKEALIADYHRLKLLAFFKKWHLSTVLWKKLKSSWGVESKIIIRRDISYWQEHRKEVMADYQSMTITEFLLVWHLSSTFWVVIRNKLGIPKKSQGVTTTEEAVASTPKTTPTADTLPVFPAFNGSWLPTVQEAWFKAFKAFVELFKEKQDECRE